ncbi:MAG TPA: TRAP transporter substrate-binding protein, partial [Vicinamibacteria bacterium]|nr:TRAP transporter substrate-binding protein [Vicinamibacteria bacterium]
MVGYGFWLGATSPAERAHVLRLGHSLNRNHPVHRGMEFMAEDVARRSGGRLRIDLYPDEQLGPERDQIELLQIGSLAMTKVSVAPLEGFSPRMT